MSSAPGPLAGRTIAVTRPRDQAAGLVAAITGAGGEALLAPALDIQPLADLGALKQVATRLADYVLAIFISPNAVAYALPHLLAHGPWPASARPAAVGPGTVAALAPFGLVDVVLPESRFDSEGLLATPALQGDAVSARKVVIFRGDGGRELLAESLRERGATVDCIACYHRSPPGAGFTELSAALTAERLDALTISSSEGLRYLLAALNDEGRYHLATVPVFVPHTRIAEAASAAGLQQVVLTKPTDSGILEGLCAYNWPQS